MVDVLAACYCKKTNKFPLIDIAEKNKINKINTLDPFCEKGIQDNLDDSFHSFEDNSYDYIYSTFCPIYAELQNRNNIKKMLETKNSLKNSIWDLFFTEGFRILRPGGSILIPIPNDVTTEHITKAIARDFSDKPYSITEIKSEDTPLFLIKDRSAEFGNATLKEDIEKYTNLFTTFLKITKNKVGGGSRKKKYRKIKKTMRKRKNTKKLIRLL
jgi:hypothetical protein